MGVRPRGWQVLTAFAEASGNYIGFGLLSSGFSRIIIIVIILFFFSSSPPRMCTGLRVVFTLF